MYVSRVKTMIQSCNIIRDEKDKRSMFYSKFLFNPKRRICNIYLNIIIYIDNYVFILLT